MIQLKPQLEPISSLTYLEPNSYYVKKILESLKNIEPGQISGSISTLDGKVHARRFGTGVNVVNDKGEISVIRYDNKAIQCSWKCIYGNEHIFCFWAEKQWSGMKGLVARLRQYLKNIDNDI